jgi:hypothetical protein
LPFFEISGFVTHTQRQTPCDSWAFLSLRRRNLSEDKHSPRFPARSTQSEEADADEYQQRHRRLWHSKGVGLQHEWVRIGRSFSQRAVFSIDSAKYGCVRCGEPPSQLVDRTDRLRIAMERIRNEQLYDSWNEERRGGLICLSAPAMGRHATGVQCFAQDDYIAGFEHDRLFSHEVSQHRFVDNADIPSFVSLPNLPSRKDQQCAWIVALCAFGLEGQRQSSC